ncbi:cache domain-containing protein [Desulfolithobacter sp.]
MKKKAPPGSRKRPSLSYAPFRASLLVIAALAFFIGIFWIINEYQTYRESIANIRHTYQELYQARVREEMDNMLGFIEHRRSQADQRVENELREKVRTAYTIASHVYRMYREEKSIIEMRTIVAELLRPIRWSNGRGSYFAGRLVDGTIDLFADNPFLEGLKLGQLPDGPDRSLPPEIIEILRDKGAGIYRYQFMKKDEMDENFPGILFVKYFAPFDWYIGATVSNEAMEQLLQEDILSTIQDMRFDKDGFILCFRSDGTIISHPEKKFIGRSITDLVGSQGTPYGRAMLEAALKPDGTHYIHYQMNQTGPGKIGQRLCYVQVYPDWNWILATDMSMASMEKAITEETRTYVTISFKNVFIFIGLFAVAVLFLLGLAYYHSSKIKHGISLFTDFFRKAADNQVKIRNQDLDFAEFEDLARLANTMVDDRILKERILRRDELRLDTLLQLGMMEGYDIRDKYDFVLHRIVQITDSASGYIALVNNTQTHATLCSRVTIHIGQFGLGPDDNATPRSVKEGGLTGACVQKKKPSILNTTDRTSRFPAYPYNWPVRRRLDVPIINDSKVVLVAGVCDSRRDYDNSDIRQMTMLLEGMWLHVLKICSEKERAILERQVIAISEEERSRIGRDLHDDLGSHLSGVELLSKVLQQKLEQKVPAEAEQLATIRELIREAIEKTRRLSRGLYPVHIREYGLKAAIEELVVELEQLFPVRCSLSIDPQVEEVATNQASHVYYIIREAMFNAARHGHPEKIEIIVRRKNRYLSARIIDNGEGFMEKDSKKGMGLHTMQYRAKAIGASLDIKPGPTGGTMVTLEGKVFK